MGIGTTGIEGGSAEFKQITGLLAEISESVKEAKQGLESAQAEIAVGSEEAKSIQETQKKFEEQLTALETWVQTQGIKGEQRDRCELDIKYNIGFSKFIRGGEPGSCPEMLELRSMQGDYIAALEEAAEAKGDTRTVDEIKSFNMGSIVAGGILVPVNVANSIVTKQRDFSDIRPYAGHAMSDIGGLVIPAEGDDFTAGWVGEGETRTTDDSGSFFGTEIPMNGARAMVPVTNELRMNRAFDIDSYITRRIADRLSRLEGNAFVLGSGVKKPTGFMTYAAGTGNKQVQQITTAATTTITHEDLTDVKTPLRGVYRKNARYFMNRFTLGYIEKLEDSAGNPLYNRGDLAKSIPDQIKGFPIVILDDMAGADPTTGALTANDLVILYADMSEFYLIVDHSATMTMLIDPYTAADSNKIKFRFFKYVGGGGYDYDAGKILKVKS